MKAVVVEIRGESAAVMTEDGVFAAIPNEGWTVGQELTLPNGIGMKPDASDDDWNEEALGEEDLFEPVSAKKTGVIDFRKIIRAENFRNRAAYSGKSLSRAAVSAAAAVAVLLGAGGAYTYAQPYGVVSLDVNPSVAYTINRFDRVLSVDGINDDGAALLDGVNLRQIRHRRIEDAVAATVEQLEAMQYLSGEGMPQDGDSQAEDRAEQTMREDSGAVSGTGEADAEAVADNLLVIGSHTKNQAHSERVLSRVEDRLHAEFDHVNVYAAVASDEEASRADAVGTTPGKLHFIHELLTEEEVAGSDELGTGALIPAQQGEAQRELGSVSDEELRKWSAMPVGRIMQERELRGNDRGTESKETTAEQAQGSAPENRKPGTEKAGQVKMPPAAQGERDAEENAAQKVPQGASQGMPDGQQQPPDEKGEPGQETTADISGNIRQESDAPRELHAAQRDVAARGQRQDVMQGIGDAQRQGDMQGQEAAARQDTVSDPENAHDRNQTDGQQETSGQPESADAAVSNGTERPEVSGAFAEGDFPQTDTGRIYSPDQTRTPEDGSVPDRDSASGGAPVFTSDGGRAGSGGNSSPPMR